MGWQTTNWFNVAQDKDKWQAVVKMAMNVVVP